MSSLAGSNQSRPSGQQSAVQRSFVPLQSGDRWAPSFRWERTNHRLAKRCLDVFGACVCLLAFLPLLLMVAVLVRLSSPGPILLRQARVGKHGRAIRIYKFRTMFANSDPTIHEAYCRSLVHGSAKPVDGMFKLGNDPRITRVGRIVRRFSQGGP